MPRLHHLFSSILSKGFMGACVLGFVALALFSSAYPAHAHPAQQAADQSFLDVGKPPGLPRCGETGLGEEEVKDVEKGSDEDTKELDMGGLGGYAHILCILPMVWTSGWQSGYGRHSFLGRAARPLYLLFACLKIHLPN